MKKILLILLYLIPFLGYTQEPTEYISLLKLETIEVAESILNASHIKNRTIELSFRVDNASSSDYQVIYEQGGVNNGMNVFVYEGKIYVGAWSESAKPDKWWGTWFRNDIISDTWYHVAIVLKNSNSLSWYLDGVFQDTRTGHQVNKHPGDIYLNSTDNTSLPSTSATWKPGNLGQYYEATADQQNIGGNGFVGDVGRLRIWNSVISGADILANMDVVYTTSDLNVSPKNLLVFLNGDYVEFMDNNNPSVATDTDGKSDGNAGIIWPWIYTFDNNSVDNDWTNNDNWYRSTNSDNRQRGPSTVNDSIIIDVATPVAIPAGSYTYFDMKINSTKKLDIPSGVSFNVSDMVTVESGGALNINDDLSCYGLGNSGTVTIKSSATDTGSLITEGDITNTTGTINVERYIDPLETWQLISSPSTDETSNVLLGHFLNEFNETDGEFYAIQPTTYELTPGDGYVAKLDFGLTSNASNPIVFTADKANSGDVSIPLNITPEEDNDPVDGFKYSNTYFDTPVGFNLVGNPYPSSINWKMLYSRNSSKIEGAYYSYSDPGDGSGVFTPHLYTDNTSELDSIINLGQGFGVVLTGNAVASSLDFSNDVRTHNRGAGFAKKASVLLNSFNLVASSNGLSDKTNFRINESSTSNYDGLYDAYKLNSFGDTPTPSFISSDFKKLAICQQPESESIDLGFNMAISGEVTFSLSSVNNFTKIILEDKETGAFTNLIQDTYTFTYSNEDAETGRFTIHFNKETLSEVEELTGMKIYSNSSSIILNSVKSLNNVEVELYNISGQKVLSKHFELLKQQEINTSLSGVYILKLTSDKGVYTSRLIFN